MIHEFDKVLSAFVRAATRTLAKIFRVLDRQDDKALDALFATLAALPEEELATAIQALARLPSGTVSRMLRLAGRPSVLRLLGG